MIAIRRTVGTLLLLAATFAGAPADAQVYKWVDEKGVTHYGQRPAQEAAEPARKLDIRVTGNDPAPLPGATCYTIQCQYERMRDDRLIRDEAWRREMETRTNLIAAQNEARARDTAVAPGPLMAGVPVVVARRIPYHMQRPHGTMAPVNPRAPQQPVEPQVRIRTR